MGQGFAGGGSVGQAKGLASFGRGQDSMLVHMTPGEVQGLQGLAEKHGGSLTINPHTGLPEAGILSSILPMALGFALGPAGFGLMSSLQAGLAVGGIGALATGSLAKGFSMGLGAYGGAGMGEGLMKAGMPAPSAMDALQPTIGQQAATQAATIPTAAPMPTAAPTPPVALPQFMGSPSAYGQIGANIEPALNPGNYGLNFNPAQSVGAANESMLNLPNAQPGMYTPPQGAITGSYPATQGPPMGIEQDVLASPYPATQGPRPFGPGYTPVEGYSPSAMQAPPPTAPATYMDRLKSGFDVAVNDPKTFFTNNKYPIMAGGVSALQAMSQQPKLNAPAKNLGMIRPYTFNRTQNPDAYGQPGSSERQYFTDSYTAGTPYAAGAGGGIVSFAAGGGISSLGGYSDGGRMLKGPGDGLSDSIPAMIGSKQPARLADGEFVVSADVVSGLGNGSTDAGARVLYAMMDRVRKQAHGTKKQISKVNSAEALPA
jgi:hypothetical protein